MHCCVLNSGQVGEQLPAVEVHEGEPGNKVSMDQLFKGKKGVLFAVPGAFTPGCSKVETTMSSLFFFFFFFVAVSHFAWSAYVVFLLVAFRLTSQVLCSRHRTWRAKVCRRSLAFPSMMHLSWLPGERSTGQMARYGVYFLVQWAISTTTCIESNCEIKLTTYCHFSEHIKIRITINSCQ